MQPGLLPEELYPADGPPGVRVSAVDEISDDYHSQLQSAGLGGLGPAEAWTVEGTSRQNTYSTHGMFRYFGKFPPPIGRKLIADHSRAGDLIVDPTCGSGTTGVEAVLLGRSAIQFDVNPLALAVATAKTTHVPLDLSTRAFEAVVRRYAPAPLTEHRLRPVGLRNPEHWFLPETANSLRGLDRATQALPEGNDKRLLRIAYLATIRRCSRATTQQGRLFLDAETALPDALETFRRLAKRAITAAAEFPVGKSVSASLHDSRAALPLRQGATPSLVIVHPPYFNAYKYSRINSLELAWMGVPPAEVRKREVREFFKVGKPENAGKYLDDMQMVLANALAAVAPDGVVAIMIGDTRLRGEHIPVTRDLINRAMRLSRFTVERVVLRVPKHTEATWVASQRRGKAQLGAPLCDYIIVLRRRP